MFRCNGVEVIRKNVSCAFTASQVCVTVVGFGFTLRQTSSLYGYGNREKRPTVARGPGEYSSMATSVILESTWCNYPVAGTQRSRPLPSSTLEPKAPLFIVEEGEAWPWQCRRNATPAHEEHGMSVCLSKFITSLVIRVPFANCETRCVCW